MFDQETKAMLFMTDTRTADASTEGRHFLPQHNLEMFVNAYNFQSSSHQSRSPNVCFLVIFANSSLGTVLLLAIPEVILLCLNVPEMGGVRCARQFLWDDSSSSIL